MRLSCTAKWRRKPIALRKKHTQQIVCLYVSAYTLDLCRMESGVFSLFVFKTSLNNIFCVGLPAFRINMRYFATDQWSNMAVHKMRPTQGSYRYKCHIEVTAENSLLLWSSWEQVRARNFLLKGGGLTQRLYIISFNNCIIKSCHKYNCNETLNAEYKNYQKNNRIDAI
jgi:hypothetical protein